MNTAATFSSDYSYSEGDETVQQPLPFAGLIRLMRGRWLHSVAAAALLGGVLSTVGFLAGSRLYESQAILRLYPQEANILYRTADDSVLKTFDSFVKAETSTVASHPVMSRALDKIPAKFDAFTSAMTTSDLSSAIEIKRNDSLIILTTKSKDAEFAQAKLTAVVNAYLARQSADENRRSEVRLNELLEREQSLLARRDEIRLQTLEVGGEFGIAALAKAHVEKVTQIESLSSRRAEIEATLETLKSKAGNTSADMQNEEIMRATLQDRALADLNFERAKREAALSTLKTRYGASSRALRDKREELAVIDQAMAARREQIKVLGQTGALTDTTTSTPESTIAEMKALLEKVTGQLDLARQEARDLNAKRATLASLEEDAVELRGLLEETRGALEVIRLESGRALPGYSVVMSPASLPIKAAIDSRKTFAAAGLVLGAILAFVAMLGAAMTNRRICFSDAIARTGQQPEVMLVSRRVMPSNSEFDRLRNKVKLVPLRSPRLDRKAHSIALAPLASGNAMDMALALASSFARTGLKTLVIDADIATTSKRSEMDGWREALAGQTVTAQKVSDNLFVIPNGRDLAMNCGAIGTAQLRQAMAKLTEAYDVVCFGCGAIEQTISTELVLAECDFALGCLTPDAPKTKVAAHLRKFQDLPRQGGAVLFTSALPNDPSLIQ